MGFLSLFSAAWSKIHWRREQNKVNCTLVQTVLQHYTIHLFQLKAFSGTGVNTTWIIKILMLIAASYFHYVSLIQHESKHVGLWHHFQTCFRISHWISQEMQLHLSSHSQTFWWKEFYFLILCWFFYQSITQSWMLIFRCDLQILLCLQECPQGHVVNSIMIWILSPASFHSSQFISIIHVSDFVNFLSLFSQVFKKSVDKRESRFCIFLLIIFNILTMYGCTTSSYSCYHLIISIMMCCKLSDC